MLEALFGADMPLAVRFFLAFLIVLGLIGATAWAVRRLANQQGQGGGPSRCTGISGRRDRAPNTPV
jgi:flagellar biogenesis protein FliO